ncbi:MAG: DUF2851 family protein [Bacteroidales bacterium]
MTEEFLTYLWMYKLCGNQFQTTEGRQCIIIHPGTLNNNGGPDFFNARIKLDETVWAGNIELHMQSSDWYRHKHHLDNAYDNVILHVVYTEDKSIFNKNGLQIPTIELDGTYDVRIYKTYESLLKSKNWIPCQAFIGNVSRFVINNWLDRLLVERLENKSLDIEKKLDYNNDDWSETFYQVFARNFGFKTNSAPFELLARSLPLKILGKHKDNLFQIESLLFGQAGLLHEKQGPKYFQDLKKEYSFLRKKYNLEPIDGSLWRFMRLRPSNFPTVRISQFAQLIVKSSHLFSKVVETEKTENYYSLFETQTSTFWETHFTFRKESLGRKKALGKSGINLLLINTVVPILFLYGRKSNNQEIIDKALRILDLIPGELNAQTKNWKILGLNTQTAFNTQALIEMKEMYCNSKRCLHCAIGNDILQKK